MAKKIEWHNGDVFVVKLKDGTYSVGQILELLMSNIVSCAFFNERYSCIENVTIHNLCDIHNLISLISCSREQLDYDIWQIIGNKPIEINKKAFPNEQFRNNGWIGTKSYDAAIVEEFIDAYYALVPWDDWYDPNFLNELLIDVSKRPSNIIYKKTVLGSL